MTNTTQHLRPYCKTDGCDVRPRKGDLCYNHRTKAVGCSMVRCGRLVDRNSLPPYCRLCLVAKEKEVADMEAMRADWDIKRAWRG